jgi:hypothetical protein
VEMTKLFYLSVSVSIVLVMSILIGGQAYVYAADKFTLDTKTTIKKVKDPIQYKLIASANGLTKTKITDLINNPSIGTISIPVTFSTVNDDIVTAGFHDEYFACGYVISSKTGLAKKYKCNEGDLEDANGNNPVPLKEFRAMAKDSGSAAKSVKIKIKVPLKDRPDVDLLKVVAMIRGEFKSKVINAENSNGKTVSHTFTFDRKTDIGPIQVGDLYFACVAGDELNPPEGNECEFKKVKTLTGTNTLKAR